MEGSGGAYGEGDAGRKTAKEAYVVSARELGFERKGDTYTEVNTGKAASKGMVSVSSMAAEELPGTEGCVSLFKTRNPCNRLTSSSLVHRSSSELHDLAIDGKIEQVEDLLASGVGRATIDSIDAYGYTALHLASDRGRMTIQMNSCCCA